tara:strand:- start:222 stop:1088 length:867 start_codon:yes stop_codon:yes gene_type:complete
MILITGITGLTGRFLYEKLKINFPNMGVRYFVRKSSKFSWSEKDDIFLGDLSNPKDIEKSLVGIKTVLHLAPRNMLQNILKSVRGSDVKRFYYVNSTGIYSKFKSSSHVDIKNEEELMKSKMTYTIIRPTMIYGNQFDGNIHILAKLINKYPIFPIIGDGSGLMHPIYADDLAYVLMKCIELEEITRFKCYNVAGKKPMTYKNILLNISKALGKKTVFFNFPYFVALLVGRLFNYLPSRILDYEKVLRIKEDKNFDYSEAKLDLDFKPLSFQEGISLEIKSLKENKIL